MVSISLRKLGRSNASREHIAYVADCLTNSSVEGSDVFVWAKGGRAYGWLFERSQGVVRPYKSFWDNCQGNIAFDLIPRLTILENSSRINSVAVLLETNSKWNSQEVIPKQWNPRYISPPEDMRELFLIRRKALASGELIESGWKEFQKYKMLEKLESLELGLLRNKPQNAGNIQSLRYLVGACELLGRGATGR